MNDFDVPWRNKEKYIVMYCIIYQFKFVNILTLIYISLFEYNFVFLMLQQGSKYISRGKSNARWVMISYFCGKTTFLLRFIYCVVYVVFISILLSTLLFLATGSTFVDSFVFVLVILFS